MPIILNVQAYRGVAPEPPLARRFERGGGVVGRGAGSDLVLDDPTKYISRAHARVELRDGGWFLVALGSNPTLVNGQPLGDACEIRLAGGERIDIGDYTLAAALEPEVSLAPPRLEPVPAVQPVPAPAAAVPSFSPGGDSLAEASILHLGGSFAAGFDPGADPLGLNLAPAAPRAPGPAYRGAESDHAPPEQAAFVLPPAAARPAPAIPDDYDPLADLLPPPAWPRPAPAHAGPPAVARHPMAQEPAAPQPVAAQPLAAQPVAPQPVAAQPLAPQPLAAQPPAARQVRPEPPVPLPVVPQPAPPKAPVQERPVPEPGQAPDGHTVLRPQAGPKPFAVPASAPASTAAPALPADDSRVLQALLRGLRLPELHSRLAPEELAELAGAMLREATAGTIGALMARALTKRESRVEMTMMAPQANNPLKFFPDAATALAHMLQGPVPGYVAPERAFAGAFVDLRAHELAVMAGTRAALAGVLRRFDPKAIEDRLQEPGMLDRVFTSGRKTKLWDRMVELYDQMALEADEDFQRLFGAAFAVAYEEQVRRLKEAGHG
ncbi:type VI secretion system-associated FHA domain protein TagH [Massilia sp. METH4]|uniref:type VI secretion system-associated FHA domain protein TagH n=1 Tax=Massilia sp. METH4 TaxID=3123041 RepID=UPI0030D57FEB